MEVHTRKRPIYLAIIWHQHQPLYVDVQHDYLIAPWVRTHATKDYYDMAAVLEHYPKIHCTINLTTSLLKQLQNYYVQRLAGCVNVQSGTVNLKRFRAEAEARIDPWVDLLVKPANSFDEIDFDYLFRNPWNAFSISEVLLERFPEYERLKFRFAGGNGEQASEQDLRELKFWFFLACFDPDFLNGPVSLPSGDACDLSMLVRKHDGKYYLRRPVTEQDCQRLLVEAFKVMSNIIPIHKKLQYHPESHKGQIELISTPYTHPILPLVFDSDVARICQPNEPLPPRFSFPDDADIHVRKSMVYYRSIFGTSPVGMWPAEGSVSQDIVPLFAKNGIRWIATDKQILDRSTPHGLSHLYPYRLSTQWSDVVILFRDTHLSDKVGFTYQTYGGEDASDDFIASVLRTSPRESEKDGLLTVILDGENAWEWYRFDHDGKVFLNSLYSKLEDCIDSGQIITVTPTEYLLGNPSRGVPPHPPSEMAAIERLWPGSWIHANFDTWIGEEEENTAWAYLLRARTDLERAGVPRPETDAPVPPPDTRDWYAYQAWESMYAAEGSDWFWWYGEDQNAPMGDKPFDIAYLTHIRNIYQFAKKYGAAIEEPELKEIIRGKARYVPRRRKITGGTMTRGLDVAIVLFRCRVAAGIRLSKVFIVGNREELGEWVPNRIPMYDDGTHGDEREGDGIWSLALQLPVNAEIHYKYTYDGVEGQWHPGDERAGLHRTIVVQDVDRMVVDDELGNYEPYGQEVHQ